MYEKDNCDENHAPVHKNIFCHCLTRKVRNGCLSDETLYTKRALITLTNYLTTYLPTYLPN